MGCLIKLNLCLSELNRSKSDLSLLLQLHIKRSNYQALIWKRSTEAYPLIPAPLFYHGWKNCNGQICVDWGDKLFPKEIQEILEDLPEETEDSDIILPRRAQYLF